MKKGPATLQLGKRGLTDEFIEGIRKTFKNRKTVKITLLRSYSRDKEEAKNTAQKLCGELKDLGNLRCRIIGFTITLKK